MSEVWEVVRHERWELIHALEQVPDEEWETSSLCPGWTVHDVVAHLVDTALTTKANFVLGFLLARFDFDRQNKHGILRERRGGPEETLERFREVADRTTGPPAPIDTRFVEAVVHGEDVRRPLGVTHTYAADAVRRALLLQARTSISFGGGKERLTDVSLRATDADVVVGEGPEVTGAALPLLMTLSGRRHYLAELDGPGLAAYDEWV